MLRTLLKISLYNTRVTLWIMSTFFFDLWRYKNTVHHIQRTIHLRYIKDVKNLNLRYTVFVYMANKIGVLNLFNACGTWPEMFIKITKFIIHLEKNLLTLLWLFYTSASLNVSTLKSYSMFDTDFETLKASICAQAHVHMLTWTTFQKKKDDYTMKENETILVDHSVKAYKLHA